MAFSISTNFVSDTNRGVGLVPAIDLTISPSQTRGRVSTLEIGRSPLEADSFSIY
jgi:hypothetical protein